MIRRATRKFNKKAIASANAAVFNLTKPKGRRLDPCSPEDAHLRKIWMDAYVAAHGQVEFISPADLAICIEPPCPKPIPKAKIDLAGIADGQKATIGGLIVRNIDGNNAPRKKITISMVVTPPGYAGGVVLECGSNKVKVYDAITAGSVVAAGTRFPHTSLPKDLWVEGVKYSDSMRDVEISIDTEGGAIRDDFVTVTVLWLDKPVVAQSGTVSAHNAKRDNYKGWTKAGNYDLKLQDYNATLGERKAWGSEASAKVHPAGFNYPHNDLKLERDMHIKYYTDAATTYDIAFSGAIPPGNDTGPAQARDDNPAPNDTIYDFDAPGAFIADGITSRLSHPSQWKARKYDVPRSRRIS
jgi:hypothetical protein